MPDDHTNARNMAIDILRSQNALTEMQIRDVANKAILAIRCFSPDAIIDFEALTAELMHLFSVSVEQATVLEDHDMNRHTPWLRNRHAEIQWQFWNRYMTYLERDFGMPPTVVTNLHNMTDMILERLEDPNREGPWDRRGMVVGSVQSGKTANYIGLINKAVDSGYKLIIVLAGIHNNLRSQTQIRIDEGVLGFDTQRNRRLDNGNRWIGVGKIPGDRLVIHSLTSSADDGDFRRNVAEQIGVMIGGDPVILVMKKNSGLLTNLIEWVQHVRSGEKTNGRIIIKDVPLILIDDEADNASINTRSNTTSNIDDASAINKKIRTLLDSFEKSVYVGYTATPFANIFINPDEENVAHGRDLFPESFIINVKPPTNYVGPAKVFGLDGDIDAGIEGSDPLPIIHEVSDYATPSCFPPKHKKDLRPKELPETLKRAIRSFVLACAARRARGHRKSHNSMLVHVSRFVEVQNHVVTLVQDYLCLLQRRIEHGDGQRTPTIKDELRCLWENEFVPITKELGEDAGHMLAWDQLDKELHPAASKICVMPINGYAKEALDYFDHKDEGLSVIAVGGNKLSRGLTLEGLSISYFLRTSRMYDTLMQMGRWFGYRPGYLDLCRLYTTSLLKTWYRHIALVDAELRREFDYMVNAGLTPRDYGLRVRTHPSGMIITAINKMCHTRKLELSWSGVLVQTAHLPTDRDKILNNKHVTEVLFGKLGMPNRNDGHSSLVWTDCKPQHICDFLGGLKYPPESSRASGPQLANFIQEQANKETPELTSWTVVLVSNTKAPQEKISTLANCKIGLIERTPESDGKIEGDSYSLKKSNILNPEDESIDLAHIDLTDATLSKIQEKPGIYEEILQLDVERFDTLKDLALAITRERILDGRLRGKIDTQRPNGKVVRDIRPKDKGLLLVYPLFPPKFIEDCNREESDEPIPIIGIAISFPTSNTVRGVEYQVGRIWDAVLQEDSAYED